MAPFTTPRTIGLTDDGDGISAADALVAGLAQLNAHRTDNLERTLFYDAKYRPEDLGMALPSQVADRVGAVLGWPAKAVDVLAQRVFWQGVHATDQSLADQLSAANRFDTEVPQVVVSALEHGCAFLVATPGDTEAGEPEAVVVGKDALNATGAWDKRRRAMSWFLSVTELDKDGQPCAAEVHLPGVIVPVRIGAQEGAPTAWAADGPAIPTGLDGVAAEVLPYKPRLGRPFGTSRITRPVMALTSSAVRSITRAEVQAELYAIPQRYLLGADESAIGLKPGDRNSAWKTIVGRMLVVDDLDGAEGSAARAQVGQFPQASAQPHMDQLRSLAQLFSGETSIPTSSLGISVDANPTSADAYAASREDIIAEAEAAIRDWRPAVGRVFGYAMAMASGSSTPPEVTAVFRDPRYTSRASAADALLKAATVFPWLGESDTALGLLGFDDTTTELLRNDKRRHDGASLVQQLTGDAATSGTSPAMDDAQTSAAEALAAKNRFDALGSAIRAGVDPDDAADEVGLSGIKFTGAVPVSLRMPEAEAQGLEQ